jgi:hypothetical protein
MGKGLIIAVLGMSLTIMVLVRGINNNATEGLRSSIELHDQMNARLIANSAIEVYLEKMRRDKNLKGNFRNVSILSGTADVFIYGVDTLLQIKAIGRYGNKSHISLASTRRRQVSIPAIKSSIQISADALNIDMNGSIEINGNDHNVDGTPGPGAAIPGITVNTPADSSYVVNELKNKISKAILGAGGSPSVSTAPSGGTDWQAITENYIFAADYTLGSGNYNSGSYGTAADPKITYVNGDVSFSGSAEGYGIMVVNGDLSLSGNFTFRGLIIAYGQSTITTRVVGNSGVYGAAIFVGSSVNLQATGNSGFYYSSQAIQTSQNNIKSSRFEVVHWWE